MKRTVILSLAISLISFSGFSQNIDKAKLDAYFDVLLSNNRFMGSVAIAQGDKLIYSKAVGFVDIEQAIQTNENSKYRIGSITKTFTAVLIFKAVEENKLILNQTIDKWFTTIGNADKITIEHLLRHRSGIRTFTDEKYLSWNTQPKTEQELIEIISNAGSEFEPDSRTNYSNSGFVLLTFILEKIYQKPYSEILEEKIIKPIGLKNTYYGKKISINDNECNSYKYLEDWKKETETDMSIPLGAGGIVSTPVDLTLFSNALFNGKLISTNNINQMKTIQERLGMGLFQMPFYDKVGFGHGGSIDGFGSTFAYFPDSNISFAFITNGINYSSNDIAIVILSGVFDKPFEIPEFTTIELTSEDLEKYLGIYSSKQLPLKMTITKENNRLFGQGTGQPSFPLEAIGKDKFGFRQAGLVLEFNPVDKTMILKQGGGVFNFEKE